MVAGQKEDGSKTIVERSEKSAFIAGEDLEPGDVVTLDGEGRVIKYRHGGGIKRYASEEQAKIEADVRLAEQSLAVREICAIMNLSEESVRLAITDCGADLCQMLAQARKIKADREEYDHQKRAEASVWLRALRRRGI